MDQCQMYKSGVYPTQSVTEHLSEKIALKLRPERWPLKNLLCPNHFSCQYQINI